MLAGALDDVSRETFEFSAGEFVTERKIRCKEGERDFRLRFGGKRDFRLFGHFANAR